jgi:hypothetical protein
MSNIITSYTKYNTSLQICSVYNSVHLIWYAGFAVLIFVKNFMYTYTYIHKNIDQLFFAIQHRRVYEQRYEH